MYANPFWSVALLAGVFALYWFVIRPTAPILETRKYIRSFWLRWWERIVAFRSYVAAAFTAVMIALPDIAVAVLPIDLSDFIGKWWAQAWTTGLTIFLALNAAMKTKPGDEKP